MSRPLWFWEDRELEDRYLKAMRHSWRLPSRPWNDNVTLHNFEHWLGTQNPRKRYDRESSGQCAVCQWLKGLGYKDAVIPLAHHSVQDDNNYSISVGGNNVLMGDHIFVANDLACCGAPTFGALHKRLREFLDEWE